MSSLRTLLQYGTTSSGSTPLRSLRVYNTNITTQDNGGRCCQWTVPAGASWAAFEVWGGGGPGAGVCCCQQGWSGGSGSYGRRIIEVDAGQQFTICAAGSTCCHSRCYSCRGFPSWVCGPGGFCMCSSGGSEAASKCFWSQNCSYSGCQMFNCGCVNGATLAICGTTGGGHGSAHCASDMHQFMPSAPFTSHTRMSRSGCYKTDGQGQGDHGVFPGGGGASGVTHNETCYCGAKGMGGLVTVYYTST